LLSFPETLPPARSRPHIEVGVVEDVVELRAEFYLDPLHRGIEPLLKVQIRLVELGVRP